MTTKIKDLIDYLIFGRVKVKIETPQFLGSQDKFYMHSQVGHLYYTTLEFRPEQKKKGNHNVKFHTIDQAYDAIIEWL
jgi:hypothetical protein